MESTFFCYDNRRWGRTDGLLAHLDTLTWDPKSAREYDGLQTGVFLYRRKGDAQTRSLAVVDGRAHIVPLIIL